MAYEYEWQIDIEGDLSSFLTLPELKVGHLRNVGVFCPKTREASDLERFGPDHREINDGQYAAGVANERYMKRSLAQVVPDRIIGLMTHDLTEFATPLCKELCARLKEQGHEVVAIGEYGPGSFGPSHYLRDGVIYPRQGK